MPGWGLGLWGLDPWGGGAAVAAPTGDNVPVITGRFPAPRSVNNEPNGIIVVRFFDADFDLNTNSALIEINGTVAYSGGTVSAGYIGKTSYSAGSLIIQLYKIGGWNYGQTITVRAYIEDSQLHSASDTWDWKVKDNPVCYTGLTPLAIERRLKKPLTINLELEPIRQKLFDVVLKPQTTGIANYFNKAARVIYQTAYGTELSTLLNKRVDRDTEALAVVVCEKEKNITVDKYLAPLKDRNMAGIEFFYNQGIVGKEYITTLHDYLDSLTYSYRVSLSANLVTLAVAVELENGT